MGELFRGIDCLLLLPSDAVVVFRLVNQCGNVTLDCLGNKP